jgi:hypothetical protein
MTIQLGLSITLNNQQQLIAHSLPFGMLVCCGRTWCVVDSPLSLESGSSKPDPLAGKLEPSLAASNRAEVFTIPIVCKILGV